jgi:DNA-binding transcriptional regulator YhcF (GntR family)
LKVRHECATFKNHLAASGLEADHPMATTSNLAKALGDFPRGDGPLYQQLAQAITQGGRAQRSAARHAPAPRTRARAEALKLSRTTVVQAYARLREAGTIESRHGSGTWVRRAGKTGWPSPRSTRSRRPSGATSCFAASSNAAATPSAS